MICAGDSYYFYLEEISKKKKRIYSDACDEGYIYSEKEGIKIKKALTELMKIYDYEIDTWGLPFPKTGGTTVKFFIAFEKGKGVYNGVYVTVSTHRDTNKMLKWVDIDIVRGTNETSGYKWPGKF